MFKKGEIVVYSATGVCRVEELCTKDFGSFSAQYYVLCPIMQKGSTVFVPAGNEALVRKIHRISSRKQLENILSEVVAPDGVSTENEAERRNRFSSILESGDRSALITMVLELYNLKRLQSEGGRRLHIADEKLLNCAENLLFEEIAYVYQIEINDAQELIKNKFMA